MCNFYPRIIVITLESCYGSPATSTNGFGLRKGVSNYSKVPELGSCHVEQSVERTDLALAFVLDPLVLGIAIAGCGLPDHLVEVAAHVPFDFGDWGKVEGAMTLALPPLVQGCGPLVLGADVDMIDAFDNPAVEKVLQCGESIEVCSGYRSRWVVGVQSLLMTLKDVRSGHACITPRLAMTHNYLKAPLFQNF
jgi:hypothetical protein